MAKVDELGGAMFAHVQGDYPSRTRKKIFKEHGYELFYNANVPLIKGFRTGSGLDLDMDLDDHYTEAELKKVRSRDGS